MLRELKKSNIKGRITSESDSALFSSRCPTPLGWRTMVGFIVEVAYALIKYSAKKIRGDFPAKLQFAAHIGENRGSFSPYMKKSTYFLVF